MSYKPSEDLADYLTDIPITSYRLVDGTYLLAEEVDYDEESNIIYLDGPLMLEYTAAGAYSLQPWIDNEPEDYVQLVGDKIICRVNTPMDLKVHYNRYYVLNNLQNTLTEEEMNEVIDQITNPLVDNLDYLNDFSKPSPNYNKEWRSKWKDN